MTLEYYDLLIAILLPFITSFVLQCKWSDATKRGIALGLAIVVSVGTALVRGDLSGTSDTAVVAATIFAASQGLYLTFSKNFDVLTEVTSIDQSPKAVDDVRAAEIKQMVEDQRLRNVEKAGLNRSE